MPSNVRYLRPGAAPVRPVTTPVPWGTAANPANLPMPRGDEEWDRTRALPDRRDVARLEEYEAWFGRAALADICGDGYLEPCQLSDYAAWMALGIAEMRRYEVDARAAEDKELVVRIAGAQYRARPVLPCTECGHDTPHTSVGAEVMCLVCGDRGPA